MTRSRHVTLLTGEERGVQELAYPMEAGPAESESRMQHELLGGAEEEEEESSDPTEEEDSQSVDGNPNAPFHRAEGAEVDLVDWMNWKHLLPRWALPPWAQGESTEQPDITECEVGPAIPALRCSACLVLASQGLFFSLVSWSSDERCVAGASQGYAWWVWGPTSLIFLLRGFTEWLALRHLLPPYCAEQLEAKQRCIERGATEGIMGETACAKVFDFRGIKLHFEAWLAVFAVLSNLSMLDIFSDTAFAASTFADLHCEGSVTEGIWDWAWQSSPCASSWAWPWARSPPLHLLILSSWLLALLQTMWPLLATIRIDEWRRISPRGEEGEDLTIWPCSSATLNNQDVFTDLARASDMLSLIALSNKSARAASAEWLAVGYGHTALAVANTSGRTACMRLFLTYFLDSTIQVQLQASMYGITVFVESGGESSLKLIQAVLSLGSSMLMILYRLHEAWDFVKLAGSIRDATADPEMYSLLFGDLAEFHRRRRWLLVYRVVIASGMCLMVLSFCGAAARLVMAHVCKDAVFNLLDLSCIDVPWQLRPSHV